MRYNAKIQHKADAFAKRQEYFCAVYLGPTDEYLVFAPRFEDNEPRCTGLPTFILYKNGRFSLDVGLDFMKFTGKLRYNYTHRIGRQRFNVYKQMFDYDNFVSESDKKLISDMVMLSQDRLLLMGDIYEALEIADRFGMTIEFYSENSETYHFIRIVPGELPKRLCIIID